MPLLTSAELDQFSHDGWLALPGILGERYSQEIRADIDEIMLAFDTTDGSVPLAAAGERSYRTIAIAERPALGGKFTDTLPLLVVYGTVVKGCL